MPPKNNSSLISLLTPYWIWILWLTVVTILANGLNLVVPQITSHAIDAYSKGTLVISSVLFEFFFVALGIFIFTFLQGVLQTYASERVARDLRMKLAAKISVQENMTIEALTPAKLLTNLTSDVDAVKTFVSQAISSIISSVFLIIGSCTLLLLIDWKLALVVMLVLPIIAGSFYIVLGRVRKLFLRGQEIIDWLNAVISESILGAALIRLVHSQRVEEDKFTEAAQASKDIGLKIMFMRHPSYFRDWTYDEIYETYLILYDSLKSE